MEYVTHTMPPYIYDNDELEKLCDEPDKGDYHFHFE